MKLDNYDSLKQAGFNDEQIQTYMRPKLQQAGFDEARINQYFQNQSGKRPLSLAGSEQSEDIKGFADTIDALAQENKNKGVNLGFKDAIRLGWEQSVVGMLKRQKEAKELTAEEAESLNFLERTVMGVTSVLADTPIFFVGGKVGAAAGGAGGAAVGSVVPGVGTAAGGAVGGVVGASAGAFSFHRAARAVLVDMYRRGEVASWDELMYRVKNTSKEFGKGLVEGTAVAAAGGVAGMAAKGAVAAAATKTGAKAIALKGAAKVAPFGGEVLGLTAASSVVEGEVPTAQSFIDNAALILTLKGTHKMSQAGFNKLQNKVVDKLYEKFVVEGKRPEEAVQEASKDPVKLQDLLSENKTEKVTVLKKEKPAIEVGGTKIPIKDAKPMTKEANAEEAVKVSKIISDLVKAASVPVRLGKMAQRKSVQGVYYYKQEMIRTRKANDLETVSHEIGHHLEKVLFGKVVSKELKKFPELGEIPKKTKVGANEKTRFAEGFAEFISNYVVDPTRAKQLAPQFFDYFEKEVSVKAPEMFKALKNAQEQTKLYAEQPSLMRVLGRVSKKVDATHLTMGEKWQAVKDKVAFNWFDDKSPIKKIVERVEKKSGKKVDFAKNPYILARMFPGWVGRAESFLQNATYDFNTLKNKGKSLKEIISPIKNEDEFIGYLVSKRALELAERKIESGIRVEDAKAVVEQFEKKYKGIAEDLYKYQDDLLQMQYDGGLITKETLENIRKANRKRVPFYRVIEKTLDYSLGSKSMASKQTIKKIKGSARDIINPIESIIKDTYETINAVERNRIGLAIADLARMDKSAEFVFKVPMPKERIVIPENIKATKKEKGLVYDKEKDSFNLGDEDVQTKDFFRQRVSKKDNEIIVFRNGKPELYELDPDVAKIINGLNPSQANGLVKFLGFFSKSLRAGATGYNATFSIKNFLRDSMFAYLTTTSGFNPILSLPGNIKMAIKKDKAYWEWKKSGGSMSSFVSMDRNALQSGIRALENTGYLKKIWNRVKAKDFAEAVDIGILEPLRFISETSELITRLGEFQSSMKGKELTKENLERAGFNSREISLDFAKGGVKSKSINTMAAFFNANLLGLAKTREVITSKPKAIKTISVLGTMGILNALANYDWEKGKEDEDIAEVLRAQRNTNYVFKIGDVIYRVPKPQQIGFISTLFHDMTIFALDKLNKNEREDVVRNLSQAFWNEFNFNPVPTAALPPAEIWFNRSLFFDRPIVPVAAEGALPEYEYTDGTHEVTKAISKTLGNVIGKENTFSPAQIEHMVRGYTGGAGNFLLGVVDAAARKAKLAPDPIKPTKKLEELPFVKAFTIRHPSAGAESVNKFYEEYKRRQKYIKSSRVAGKHFDFESQQELSKYQAYRALDGINNQLSGVSAQIRTISRLPDMSADEKRQNIDSLYLLRIQIAKQGLEMIKSIDEQTGLK